MGNPFQVNIGPGAGPGLSGLANVLDKVGEKREAKEAKEAEVERQNLGRVAVLDAMNSGDPMKMAEVGIQYPEISKQARDAFGFSNPQTEEMSTRAYSEIVSGDRDSAIETLRREIPRIQAAGGNPENMLNDLQRLEGGDKDVFNEIKMGVLLANPELSKAYQSYQKEGGGKKIGISPASPKDFTVDSLANYEASGQIGDLVRYRPEIKEIQGVQHQYDPDKLMWVPLVDMRSSALSDQVRASIELEAEKQSKLDFTKAQSKFREKESKLISSIGTGRSKDVILQSTATEMRDLASGWSTAYGASLSSLPATEARKMKGLINTIRANSAFTTLVDLKSSGGTLGAISEAELVLLESAMGSLDQVGTIEELYRVLDQILQANESAMMRVENAYQMDKGKYGSSFEEATRLSDDEILGKYQ